MANNSCCLKKQMKIKLQVEKLFRLEYVCCRRMFFVHAIVNNAFGFKRYRGFIISLNFKRNIFQWLYISFKYQHQFLMNILHRAYLTYLFNKFQQTISKCIIDTGKNYLKYFDLFESYVIWYIFQYILQVYLLISLISTINC